MQEFTLRPVTGLKFIGRKKLLSELVGELSDLKSLTGYCIYGKRRVGKTSLLREVKRKLALKKDVVVAYLSLYDVANLSAKTFIEELSSSIVDAYSEKGILSFEFKLKELAKTPLSVLSKLLNRVLVNAEIGKEIRLLVTFGREEVDDYTPYLWSLFNLGEKLARETKTKCVVMLDEFPEVLKIKNGMQLVKMLRTAQESHEKTALVISGSIRKTLKAVALSDASPFYKQLVPKKIEPLTGEEVKEFLRVYLNSSDENLAKRLEEETCGIPFYLQYLGRVLKGFKTVNEAVSFFVREEGSVLFQEEFDVLSGKEKAIIVALSRGKSKPSEIAAESGEPINVVSRYLLTLSDEEIVEKTGRGYYKLADKMFSTWLKTRFNQED